MAGHEGGCQCGAVRYRVEGEGLELYACHCTECQRQSGSAFGLSWIVPRESFRLLSGEPARFTRSCDSGRTLTCFFCPTCGTRIHHQRGSDAEVVSVKAGTLDDRSWLAPRKHIWRASAQRWVALPEDSVCFDREPD